MLTGRCLCGGCSYTIEGDPIVIAHCSCRDCQRITGTGHSTGAMFAEEGVSLAGNPCLFSLESDAGNTVTRMFCGACGSPLFGKNTGMPGFMTVSLGTLDDPNTLTPQVAIFSRTRPYWDSIDLSVESFDSQPTWKPSDGI